MIADPGVYLMEETHVQTQPYVIDLLLLLKIIYLYWRVSTLLVYRFSYLLSRLEPTLKRLLEYLLPATAKVSIMVASKNYFYGKVNITGNAATIENNIMLSSDVRISPLSPLAFSLSRSLLTAESSDSAAKNLSSARR
jgi:hypothetical protein